MATALLLGGQLSASRDASPMSPSMSLGGSMRGREATPSSMHYPQLRQKTDIGRSISPTSSPPLVGAPGRTDIGRSYTPVSSPPLTQRAVSLPSSYVSTPLGIHSVPDTDMRSASSAMPAPASPSTLTSVRPIVTELIGATGSVRSDISPLRPPMDIAKTIVDATQAPRSGSLPSYASPPLAVGATEASSTPWAVPASSSPSSLASSALRPLVTEVLTLEGQRGVGSSLRPAVPPLWSADDAFVAFVEATQARDQRLAAASNQAALHSPRDAEARDQRLAAASNQAALHSPRDAEGSLRAAIASQSATIQDLERRLARTNLELASRDTRINELTRKNAELETIKQDLAIAPRSDAKAKGKRPSSTGPEGLAIAQIPDAKAKSKRPSSTGPQDSSLRDRDRNSISNTDSSLRDRDRNSMPNSADRHRDDIDKALTKYLLAAEGTNIELEKLRKGWYLVKPLGKKVFFKLAGKDQLVVRVGGGFMPFEKFLVDFIPAV